MTESDSEIVMQALVEQLRVTEARLKLQVDELRQVATVHAEITAALRAEGRQALASLVETVEARVQLAASEVEHGIAAWRRAVHRSLTDTQPIRVDG